MINNVLKGINVLNGFVKQNSPTILTSISVVGLFTTVFTAIRATPKAMSLIDDEVYFKYEDEMLNLNENVSFNKWMGSEEHCFSDRMKKLTKKEILQIVWKEYLPSLALGMVTVTCIIGSNRISMRRSAALASLYGLTDAAFKEYKNKVVETMGEAKERKVRDEIAQEKIKSNPSATSAVIVTGKGDVLCYDTLSGRYFRSDIDKIQRIVNSLNYELRSSMFLSVNELYYRLGLANISLGSDMGWDIDKGEIELEFSAQLTDSGEPCLVLEYKVSPKYK